MTRLFSIILLFVILLSLQFAIHAQEERTGQDLSAQPVINSDSLKTLINDNSPGYSVIQPGSENAKDKSSDSVALYRLIAWIMNFLNKIGSWLDRHLGGIAVPESSGKLVNLNWLFVVIVLVVLIFFVISILPVLRRGRKTDINSYDEEATTVSISVRNALERSRELATKNDLTGALRELLIGFFIFLDECGKIPFRRSRTNREYSRIIKRKAPSQYDFAGLFLPYMDGVLYAGIQPEKTDYDRFRDYVEKIVST
jgi:uncharacterized membrane protein